MGIVKIVLLILAGLGGVIATEAGVITWLTYAPLSLDLTGNYFTLTILPVVVVVVILAAVLLWKILAANPLRNGLIFTGVYIAAESFGLMQLGNPLTVVASYALVMACVCGVVFTSFARLIWTRPG
jgi:hypothetical protein